MYTERTETVVIAIYPDLLTKRPVLCLRRKTSLKPLKYQAMSTWLL